MIRDNNTILYKGSDGISIAEVNTVLHGGSLDLGVLCRSGNINPWAKYKPFRNSVKFFKATTTPTAKTAAENWYDAMEAAGFGFGSTLNNINFSPQQTCPSWGMYCNLPRGVNNSYNEAYRIFDFTDLSDSSIYGYNHNAVPPMEVDFPTTSVSPLEYGISQGGCEIVLGFDRNVSGWDENTCISISNILNNGPAHSSWPQYNLAVLFKNRAGYVNLLVTEYNPTQFSTSLRPSIYFTGSAVSGSLYTIVPMFDESYNGPDSVFDGDNVETTVCLVANRQSQTYPYVIGYQDTQYSLGSLELVSGLAVKNLVFRERTSIVGMTGTFVIEVSRISHKDPVGTNLKAFQITKIKLEGLNPGPNWGDATTGIHSVFITADLAIENGAWVWSNSSDVVPQDTPYWPDEYVRITAASSGNNFATIALSYGDGANVSRDVYSPGSTAMSYPYIFVSTNSSTLTFKVRGKAYKHAELIDVKGDVDLTSGSAQVNV